MWITARHQWWCPLGTVDSIAGNHPSWPFGRPAEVDHLAEDRTSWVDECGQVFVVDRAAPEGRLAATNTLVAQMPADVFSLSSRPSSSRTVHLDFDGATHTSAPWNGGAEVVSPACSVDADRTTFSETERAQIYLAWRVVAEEYAPFDINVTTAAPAASALSRTSSSDTTYGMSVVITSTNAVGTGGGCGGQAYVGVFDIVGTTDYQPTWVYTNGSGVGGYNMGQVISHEVGHTLGLGHDGTSQSGYYSGANGWAPIMGSSYNRRASQWSSGEYPDVGLRLPQGLAWRVKGDTILIRGTVRRPVVRSFGTELAADGASVRQRYRLVVG